MRVAECVWLLAWLAPTALLAGGPDPVRIELYSIFSPRSLDLAAVGDGQLRVELRAEDGQARSIAGRKLVVACGAPGLLVLDLDQSRHQAAGLELVGSPPAGQVWIGVPGRQPARPYGGRFELRSLGGRCQLIQTLDLERYVREVACRELGTAPVEALRAQAVLVRTWALTNRGRHAQHGFDFCDLTHCQAHQGESACRAEQEQALEPVAGQVLLAGQRLAEVAYSSSCGGHTARAEGVWGPEASQPYLRGISDGDPALCAGSPHHRWRLELGRERLCAALRAASAGLGPGACRLEVLARGPGGWVERIRATAQGSAEWSGEQFHLLMGRGFGWGRFKSANFVVQPRGDKILFLGRGLGHGVGLCQHGALELARQGADHRRILEHYFPGTQLGVVP